MTPASWSSACGSDYPLLHFLFESLLQTLPRVHGGAFQRLSSVLLQHHFRSAPLIPSSRELLTNALSMGRRKLPCSASHRERMATPSSPHHIWPKEIKKHMLLGSQVDRGCGWQAWMKPQEHTAYICTNSTVCTHSAATDLLSDHGRHHGDDQSLQQMPVCSSVY